KSVSFLDTSARPRGGAVVLCQLAHDGGGCGGSGTPRGRSGGAGCRGDGASAPRKPQPDRLAPRRQPRGPLPEGGGLLQPEVNSRRTARSHPGVRVTENAQVGFAVTVEIGDVDPVLVVDAVFQRNPLHALFAQAIFVTQENEHLIGLAVSDDQIINAVAVPV